MVAPTYKNYALLYSFLHEEEKCFVRNFCILMYSCDAKNFCELLITTIIVFNDGASARFFKPGMRLVSWNYFHAAVCEYVFVCVCVCVCVCVHPQNHKK